MASARKWLLPGKWRQMLAPDCRQILLDCRQMLAPYCRHFSLDWRQMLAPDWRQIWSQESNLYRRDSRLQLFIRLEPNLGS